MPYIGNEPADRFTSIPTVQQFNGDGSTTAFTLSRTVSSDQDILVSVDGVIQDTAAYAVSSGTTLTFSAAPSTGTANIFVNHLGLTIGSVVHPASSALVATTGAFSSTISIAGGIGELSAPSANDLAIYGTASGHTGIRFHDVGILPTNNAGAIIDNDCDIGIGTHRFKDLYLSGGAYLGGAVAANKLDDYEEGTFTPTLAFTSAGNSSFGYSAQVAHYVKVGDIVHFQLNLRLNAFTKGTGSGTVLVAGLPFTAHNTSGYASANSPIVINNWPFDSVPVAMVGDNTSFLRLYKLASNTSVADLNDPDSDAMIWLSGTYRAA